MVYYSASHNRFEIDRKEHNRHEQPVKRPLGILFSAKTLLATESPSKAFTPKLRICRTKRYERLIALIDWTMKTAIFLIFSEPRRKEHTKFIRNGFPSLREGTGPFTYGRYLSSERFDA